MDYLEKMEIEIPKFKVGVQCFTFNQSNFIVSTLDGFVSQVTNFPYACVIVDDASTDGEQGVLNNYIHEKFTIIEEENDEGANIFFAKNNVNTNCYFVVVFLKYNFYSIGKSKAKYFSKWIDNTEYTSCCEGDDYWINEHKLQSQVDFLDEHKDYTACLTKFYKFDQEKDKYVGIGGNKRETIYDMLWKDVDFGTATIMFRTNIYMDYIKEIRPEGRNWLMGDKPIFLYMGYRGRVKTLDMISSVYRILKVSASHSNDISLQIKRARNTIDIYHYFARKYLNEDTKLFNKIEGGFLYRVYLTYKNNGGEYPSEIKHKIFEYQGMYWKLYLVKLFLYFPVIQNLVYSLAKIKDIVKFKLKKQ